MSPATAGLDLPLPAVEALLLDHYGIVAESLRVFDSELSTVCRVRTARGALVFKAVHHLPEEHEVAAWRLTASEHLADHGIPVGRVVRNLNGELLAAVATQRGLVSVQVGQWLEGTPLLDAPLTSPLLNDVGNTAAQISRLLADWPRPPFPVEHPWELTRSLTVLEQVMQVIDDDATRELITETEQRFTPYASVLETLPRATAHHDLHDANLLVDVATARVCGVLDMGDMVPAPRVAELVVAAAYACRGAADPADAFLRVAEGWGTTVPLTSDEIAVLFPSALARLAVNMGIWRSRTHSDRGNYARARSGSSLRTLQALLTVDTAAMESALHDRLSA